MPPNMVYAEELRTKVKIAKEEDKVIIGKTTEEEVISIVKKAQFFDGIPISKIEDSRLFSEKGFYAHIPLYGKWEVVFQGRIHRSWLETAIKTNWKTKKIYGSQPFIELLFLVNETGQTILFDDIRIGMVCKDTGNFVKDSGKSGYRTDLVFDFIRDLMNDRLHAKLVEDFLHYGEMCELSGLTK